MRTLTDSDHDLASHLLSMRRVFAPEDRQRGYWVMSQAWREELKWRFADESNQNMAFMFGHPVRVEEGAGFPKFVVPESRKYFGYERFGFQKEPPFPSHEHACTLTGQEIHERLLRYLTSRGMT